MKINYALYDPSIKGKFDNYWTWKANDIPRHYLNLLYYDHLKIIADRISPNDIKPDDIIGGYLHLNEYIVIYRFFNGDRDTEGRPGRFVILTAWINRSECKNTISLTLFNDGPFLEYSQIKIPCPVPEPEDLFHCVNNDLEGQNFIKKFSGQPIINFQSGGEEIIHPAIAKFLSLEIGDGKFLLELECLGQACTANWTQLEKPMEKTKQKPVSKHKPASPLQEQVPIAGQSEGISKPSSTGPHTPVRNTSNYSANAQDNSSWQNTHSGASDSSSRPTNTTQPFVPASFKTYAKANRTAFPTLAPTISSSSEFFGGDICEPTRRSNLSSITKNEISWYLLVSFILGCLVSTVVGYNWNSMCTYISSTIYSKYLTSYEIRQATCVSVEKNYDVFYELITEKEKTQAEIDKLNAIIAEHENRIRVIPKITDKITELKQTQDQLSKLSNGSNASGNDPEKDKEEKRIDPLIIEINNGLKAIDSKISLDKSMASSPAELETIISNLQDYNTRISALRTEITQKETDQQRIQATIDNNPLIRYLESLQAYLRGKITLDDFKNINPELYPQKKPVTTNKQNTPLALKQ